MARDGKDIGQLFVNLVCEEPQRLESGEIKVNVYALVVLKNQKAEVGREVQFFISGIGEGRPLVTDLNGRAVKEIVIPTSTPQKNTCVIDAQVVGSSAFATKTISLPPAKSMKAKEIISHQIRLGTNELQVRFRLMSEGKPIQGEVVIISTKEMGENIITGKDGWIIKKFFLEKFSEKTVVAELASDPRVCA